MGEGGVMSMNTDIRLMTAKGEIETLRAKLDGAVAVLRMIAREDEYDAFCPISYLDGYCPGAYPDDLDSWCDGCRARAFLAAYDKEGAK